MSAIINYFWSNSPSPQELATKQAEKAKLRNAIVIAESANGVLGLVERSGLLSARYSSVNENNLEAIYSLAHWGLDGGNVHPIRMNDHNLGRDVILFPANEHFPEGLKLLVFDKPGDFERAGSFKKFHLAVNLQTNEVVGLLTSDQRSELADAQTLSELYPYSNIAKCYDCGFLKKKVSHVEERLGLRGHQTETIYIIVKFYQGGSLQDFLNSRNIKAMSLKQRLILAEQLAQGVANVHDQGIIHRDLKAQNVLVDEKGNIAISDFGLSTHKHTIVQSGRVSDGRTDTFVSPEYSQVLLQCGDDLDRLERELVPVVDYSYDVWSLGVILHQLLSDDCNVVPWYGARDCLHTIASLPKGWASPKFGHPHLSDIMTRTLSPDPKERPSAHEIHRRLADIRTSLP